MKKIALLSSLLFGLLFLTWLLTESQWFSAKSSLERVLQHELKNPHRYQLPAAQLVLQEGVWRTSEGELVRAEVLEELHRSLEAISVARVINQVTDRSEYFSDALKFSINQRSFEWGSMAPTGDSFYLGVEGDPAVYVIDLREMGSLAVADNEKVLLNSKYQRLRDLLLYPEARWREERLLALLQFSQFSRWKKDQLVLDSDVLVKRPWGKAAINAFLAGLQSLKVQGQVITVKPDKPSRVASWVFNRADGKDMTCDFYEHPNVDVIYVWIDALKKGYPLDQESSDFIQRFPERLLNRSFSLTLGEPGVAPQLLEKGVTFTKENEATMTVSRFIQTQQTFQHLSLISGKDCQELSMTSNFQMLSQGVVYAWRRVTGGWAILDCESGLSFTWSLPLESPMDFVNLNTP